MKFLLAAINAKYIHSNPGVYSLRAFARTKIPGADIEIGEYTINHQMDLILQDIYRRKPDFIGFSCYIWNISYIMEIVRDVKKVLPEVEIWLGGPEVSYDAKKVLTREPDVCGVMRGEGELTFTELVRAYLKREELCAASLDLDHIPGITYRAESGEVVERGPQRLLSLDEIPFYYDDMAGFENRIVYYESSRGCPFSCSYCLSSIDKTVRFRSLDLVLPELQFFLDHKVPQVKFVDRTFNCKRDHTLGIWRYLVEHDNGITNFHFEVSADIFDEEELELIGKMRPGLIQLEIGVQSTNPDTIKEIHRHMDLVKLKQAVDRVYDYRNTHQHLDLIAGLPYENYESFMRSFDDVYRMRPDQLQMGFLKVLKGSYMEEQVAAYDLKYRGIPPYEVLSTKWLPYSDVIRLKGVEDMVEVYYNSGQFPATMKLLEKKFDIDGHKEFYLSTVVFQYTTAEPEKKKLQAIQEAAVQAVQENYTDQPHVEAQVAMMIANQAADNDNQVSVEQVRRQLEEDYPLAAVPFDDYVEKSDVLDYAQQPVTVTPARIRRMESRSIHTANGIEVKIPTELLNEESEVEFLHDADGSVSLLIKNVIL